MTLRLLSLRIGIIEYLIREQGQFPLLEKNLREFAEETASESPAPGGGSISAYAGSLGAALSTMVANLSANKREDGMIDGRSLVIGLTKAKTYNPNSFLL